MSEKVTAHSSKEEKKLSIEILISAAFNRTKERFLPYLLAAIFGVGLVSLAIIAMGLLGGVVFLLWLGTKSTVITAIFGTIAVIGTIAGFIYIQSWLSLTIVYTIIAKQRVSVTDAFKTMRPLIKGYIWVSIVNFLLLFGLLPFGIVTILILSLVWVAWSMFTIYVYIEKRMHGLDNLFMSKAIISKKFWGFVFRIAVIYVLYFIGFFIIQAIGRESRALSSVIYMIFSFLAGPFMLSYMYEMYHNFEHPKDVGSKQIWIILSAIGWVIMIIGIFTFSSFIGREIPKIQQNILKQEEKNNKVLPFPSDIYDDVESDVDYEEISPGVI